MSFENSLFTAVEESQLAHTLLRRHRLEEQYATLEQQSETAALGMWVFLATEVMFFGTLFAALGVYRYQYGEAFERASEKLNWLIGGVNTVVLLISSFLMVMAVHEAKLGRRLQAVSFLSFTAVLGMIFLGFKGLEYYLDFRENLVPGWKFDPRQWVAQAGLSIDQVPHVELFLLFYWITTGFHALHVIIGVTAVLVIAVLTWKRDFTGAYHAPVEVLAPLLALRGPGLDFLAAYVVPARHPPPGRVLKKSCYGSIRFVADHVSGRTRCTRPAHGAYDGRVLCSFGRRLAYRGRAFDRGRQGRAGAAILHASDPKSAEHLGGHCRRHQRTIVVIAADLYRLCQPRNDSWHARPLAGCRKRELAFVRTYGDVDNLHRRQVPVPFFSNLPERSIP